MTEKNKNNNKKIEKRPFESYFYVYTHDLDNSWDLELIVHSDKELQKTMKGLFEGGRTIRIIGYALVSDETIPNGDYRDFIKEYEEKIAKLSTEEQIKFLDTNIGSALGSISLKTMDLIKKSHNLIESGEQKHESEENNEKNKEEEKDLEFTNLNNVGYGHSDMMTFDHYTEEENKRNNIQHAKIIKQQLKQSNEKQERKQKNKISKLSSTLKPDLDSYTNKIIDIVLACVEEGDIDIAMTREQKDRIKRIHKQINNQDQKQDQKSNENDFNEEDLRKCPFCKSKNIIEGGNEFDFDLIIPIAYFFYSCEDCKKEWVVKLIPTKSIKQ